MNLAYLEAGNRKRKNRISFYVTEDELNLIKDKFKKTNYTNRGDFIRDNVLNNIIVVNDYSHLRNLIVEINKIGVNINQIAKVVNTNQFIYKDHIDLIFKRLNEVWDLINEKF